MRKSASAKYEKGLMNNGLSDNKGYRRNFRNSNKILRIDSEMNFSLNCNVANLQNVYFLRGTSL